MKKKIAIIGSGISGLTCAYLLSKEHEVHLFEANDYLGGHTATKTVTVNNQDFDIDTGFIVFNEWTYSRFIKLLDQIGIKKQKTQMSFSVFDKTTGFEYNGHTLSSLFSQRRNLFSLKFYRFLWEIIRFNKLCKQYKNQNIEEDLTLFEFIDRYKFSQFFSQYYILPMVAAIWSGSLEEAKDFQFAFFLKFFMNHGLLNIINRPQWFVIENGSKSYIKPLIKPVHKIYLATKVNKVQRFDDKVVLKTKDSSFSFDEVIFASHSDQSLAMIENPTREETDVLSRIPYRNNDVSLHTDLSKLPRYKASWASWNFMNPAVKNDAPKVTYNMNILQSLNSDITFCVSLNQKGEINDQNLLAEYQYSHPIIKKQTIEAQNQRALICGLNRTHFCGAYWYQGFHEDGVHSALDVCERFGVSL